MNFYNPKLSLVNYWIVGFIIAFLIVSIWTVLVNQFNAIISLFLGAVIASGITLIEYTTRKRINKIIEEKQP